MCLGEAMEDRVSPGGAEPSEDGEGEPDVDMGERKKRIAQLWHPYICAI